MVSSGARTIDVFRSAGTAMATRTVPTEQMKAIVLPSLVQKTNLSVRRAGQIPRPNALIRPSCVTGNKTARTALMKRTLAVSGTNKHCLAFISCQYYGLILNARWMVSWVMVVDFYSEADNEFGIFHTTK